MSLTKEALDTITATAFAASGAPLDTHVPAVLVPDGYRVENLEALQERPARFRGTFTTHSIPAFAQYVKQHAVDGESAGFIDQKQMLVRVFFDRGNLLSPGFGAHTARIDLVPTAPYQAVWDANQRGLSQDALVEFIEDWAPHIEALDENGSAITLPAAIHAIRHMRIEGKTTRESEIGDFSAKRGALEEIEAKSKGHLPRTLEFRCVPYERLDPITIRLRVAVLTGEDKPKFRLRWVNKESQIETIARNFREVLSEELDNALPLLDGVYTNKNA